MDDSPLLFVTKMDTQIGVLIACHIQLQEYYNESKQYLHVLCIFIVKKILRIARFCNWLSKTEFVKNVLKKYEIYIFSPVVSTALPACLHRQNVE